MPGHKSGITFFCGERISSTKRAMGQKKPTLRWGSFAVI